MRLRVLASAALGIAALAASVPARAAEGDAEQASADKGAAPQHGDTKGQAAASAADRDLAFHDWFVLDGGRFPFHPRDPHSLGFELHGEYEVRFRAMSDLPLEAPLSAPQAKTLGQNQYLYHWARLSPRIDFRDKLSLVAQLDIPRGLIVGDTTQYVSAAREPLDQDVWYDVKPRYLYLEYDTSIGVFRLGQQGSHWGMGIVANDGDHQTMFGDYLGGSLVERFLFATTPLGKGTPLVVAIAGDIVYEDPTARLIQDHDRAFQGALAVLWRGKQGEIGAYGVVRHQERDAQATDAFTPFTNHLTVGVADLTGKFNGRIPGARAFAYSEFEAAAIVGDTDFIRASYMGSIDPTVTHPNEKVRSYGGAAMLGTVHLAGQGDEMWGDGVFEIEAGYASGDANPDDGTTKRFTFDPNHNVGLVLFHQVMAWKTARAATIAADPKLVARAAPGLEFLPSNGGVFGAEYLNPRGIYRPVPWLDLKGGVVIAQTTADFVDPYHFGALGSPANYDGGDARRHDLGLELDLGVDTRTRIAENVRLTLGAEGGVLFPGHAFDDASGHSLPNQFLLNSKVGMLF